MFKLLACVLLLILAAVVNVKAMNPDCQLPIATGQCKSPKEVYGYNSESEQCEVFTYGGCGGNRNRFASKEQCERACEGQGAVEVAPQLFLGRLLGV